MSFSRNYRFHREPNAVRCHQGYGRDPLITHDGRRRRRRLSNDVYYGSGGPEAGGPAMPPPFKRRRSSSSSVSSAWQQAGISQFWTSAGVAEGGAGGGRFCRGDGGPSTSRDMFSHPATMVSSTRRSLNSCGVPGGKRKAEPVTLAEDEDPVFMSRDEIERSSPSRKDGIDLLHETHLRYSYCAFLQNLGMRLELPQTTIGTAMVLCHRFFVRRSHACHDRFLIATAALFLAAKSEETPRLLNNVVKVYTEICCKQNPMSCPYSLPIDWFEKYRERVIEAENLILTTLDFELNVQHPYTHLASVLNKLGLSQTVLVNMAWNLINEGLRSSLWLQFKPHHIAAGAVFLAAQFLNFDVGFYQSILREFQTAPSIIQDVVQQLLELFVGSSLHGCFVQGWNPLPHAFYDLSKDIV